MALIDNISARPRNQKAKDATRAALQLAQVAHEHVEDSRQERDKQMIKSLPRASAPQPKPKTRHPQPQSAREPRGQENNMNNNRPARRGDERRTTDRSERRGRDGRQDHRGDVFRGLHIHPANWIKDGVDHINMSTFGATEIGKVLDLDFEMPWTHPQYGRFISLSAFWYYITSANLDRSFAWMASNLLRQRARTANQGQRKTVDNLRAIMIDAAYHRISAVPAIAQSLRETTLPLDFYVEPRGRGPEARSHRGLASWYIPGMEYIRRALQTGDFIQPDGSLDVTPFMDNIDVGLFSGVGEEKPVATGEGLLGKLFESENPPTEHMRRMAGEQEPVQPRKVKPVKTKAVKKVVAVPQAPKEPGTPVAHLAPESEFPIPEETFTYRLGFADKTKRNATLFGLADSMTRDTVLFALQNSETPLDTVAALLALAEGDLSDADDSHDLWLTVQVFGEQVVLVSATDKDFGVNPYSEIFTKGDAVPGETQDILEGDVVVDAAVVQPSAEMVEVGLENLRLHQRSRLRSELTIVDGNFVLKYIAPPVKDEAAVDQASASGAETDVLTDIQPTGDVQEDVPMADSADVGEPVAVVGDNGFVVAHSLGEPTVVDGQPPVAEDGVVTEPAPSARSDERIVLAP